MLVATGLRITFARSATGSSRAHRSCSRAVSSEQREAAHAQIAI